MARGRPRLPIDERRRERLEIRLRPGEARRFRRLARQRGVTLSTLVRTALAREEAQNGQGGQDGA